MNEMLQVLFWDVSSIWPKLEVWMGSVVSSP